MKLIAETNWYTKYSTYSADEAPYQPEAKLEVYRIKDEDIRWLTQHSQDDEDDILNHFMLPNATDILEQPTDLPTKEYYTFINFTSTTLIVEKIKLHLI